MSQLLDLEAPMGLGFEMPEELWILRLRRGVADGWAQKGENFVNVWASEDDVVLAAHRRKVEAKPEPTSWGDLREAFVGRWWRKQLVDGIRLLDRDCNELGRRYFR
jgi:hypothetical protein